jgi:uncharacterized protein (DUF362 family)
MDEISRREFIRKLMALGLSAAGASALASNLGCASGSSATPMPVAEATGIPTIPLAAPTAAGALAPTVVPMATPVARVTPAPSAGQAYLAVVRGDSPTALVQTALKALGGIERFVKPGNDVIIKPNICVAYHSFEYAATTNPEVVAALVKLCLGAGAKRVRVMDAPFGGTASQAYDKTGIGEAVKAAGGVMETMAAMKYEDTAIPQGRDITKWKVYRDVLQTDVLIDVPIAKTHNLARLTLGMKNLLGVVEQREQMHANLGQRVADLTSLVKPTLTVVDAVRILKANGPTGGNLNDVQLTKTIIASHDIVAADSYATSLFGLKPSDIAYINAAAKMGLGTTDLQSVKVEEISV